MWKCWIGAGNCQNNLIPATFLINKDMLVIISYMLQGVLYMPVQSPKHATFYHKNFKIDCVITTVLFGREINYLCTYYIRTSYPCGPCPLNLLPQIWTSRENLNMAHGTDTWCGTESILDMTLPDWQGQLLCKLLFKRLHKFIAPLAIVL